LPQFWLIAPEIRYFAAAGEWIDADVCQESLREHVVPWISGRIMFVAAGERFNTADVEKLDFENMVDVWPPTVMAVLYSPLFRSKLDVVCCNAYNAGVLTW
jgi:hypothetical protein